MTDEKTKVKYVKPSTKRIEHVARAACARLEPPDPDFEGEEIVQGLAEFLHVVCRVETDRMNRQHAAEALDKKPQTA